MRETTKLPLALVSLLLVMLLGLAFPRPLAAAIPIADMASLIYDTLEGPPRDQLSPSILQWEGIYKTYTEATLPAKRLHLSRLLKAGMNGDIHALAMATVLAQNDPDCAALGRFDDLIEPWLRRHLGEGEACWLLGVFHAYWLSLWPPYHELEAMRRVESYMKQAALADHPKAMAFPKVLPVRADPHFVPAAGKEVHDTLPAYLVGKEKEKYYWLLRASEAGTAHVSSRLGYYLAEKSVNKLLKEASEKALFYLDRGARQGSPEGALYCGVFLEKGGHYIDKRFDITVKKNCRKAFFYFALWARLVDHGEYIKDPNLSPEGAGAEQRAQWYMYGNPDEGIQVCMTQQDYQDGLDESLAAYQQYAAQKEKQEAALRQLYDQARAALPELRPALEQKMRQMPQPKSAPVSTRAPIPIPIPVIEIPE